MTASLKIYHPDGTLLSESVCIRFSLLRERYLPHSVLSADFFCEHSDYSLLCRVQFFLDGVLLHDGILRSYTAKTEKNRRILHITSHSFAEALLHNQLTPGLHLHVTLSGLMTTYELPHMTYEENIPETTYIYVRDGTAMWDSIAGYNYKLNIGYPYVTLTNHLRMTPKSDDDPITIPANDILSTQVGGDLSNLISRIDMADIDGTYGTFSMSNPEATGRGITRVKQILMDRMFLYDPYQALYYRLAVSNRRLKQKIVTYFGYCGEDIEDLMKCEGFLQDRVSRILIIGDNGSVRTTDTFYYDSFCNT